MHDDRSTGKVCNVHDAAPMQRHTAASRFEKVMGGQFMVSPDNLRSSLSPAAHPLVIFSFD